ncbi:unnamed protein product [Rotaria sp. Silwood2]|nr:unnamed protein product [Rotaria sp. Silwood2]CAF3040081.1 unnamed protein product [Rotaria sp. Silwood2]CAF3401198.1 unnamed protein product [Rotaria sp. Silwood2]CAF4402707.1 unnamed protein product [Rotaria sp. Silwood2]CAF4447216.1 unnamed protein product [Rotaria sp. Silwood2]
MMLCLTIILLSCVLVDTRYSLYCTDSRQTFYPTFDCLYAYTVVGEKQDGAPYIRNYHLTAYCRRPNFAEEKDNLSMQDKTKIKPITFRELNQQKVTSEQLLMWSAPIDIAERYEINSTTSEAFYNCSPPWFGSVCQYKFPYDFFSTFSDIVNATFTSRLPNAGNVTNGTCYRFLANCNHSLWPLCLDWREICDGKADCKDASDEQWCEQLEMSQCTDDEYRCHYGGQCIPRTFHRDNPYSVDCLDGSDEKEQFLMFTRMFNARCVQISTFICEERIGRFPRTFQCGDGQYLYEASLPSYSVSCANQRDKEISRILFTSLDHISQLSCQQAFYCALQCSQHNGNVEKEQKCRMVSNLT